MPHSRNHYKSKVHKLSDTPLIYQINVVYEHTYPCGTRSKIGEFVETRMAKPGDKGGGVGGLRASLGS